jgi:hypothetical protein
MEPIETNEPLTPGETTGIILNEEAQYYLQKSGEWARFLGIMGFICAGLVLIAALFMGSIFSMMSAYQANPYPAGMGGLIGGIYILLAVFYFFFSLYLYQFGNKIKSGIGYSDPIQVTNALSKLKSFFKLIGISTIVIMALYLLIIIGFIIGASVMRG